MIWIAPSEKDDATAALEKRLWAAADIAARVSANPACEATRRDFREAKDDWSANSGLKPQEYSAPVLGPIFLRFAEVRFAAQRAKLEKAGAKGGNGSLPRRGSRVDEPAAYHAEGILYLPAEARFDYLLHRPEAENIGAKVNPAMRDIEKHNPQLAGVLPKTYNLFTSALLKELLKQVSEIGFLANLVRLYRGEALDFTLGGEEARAKIQEVFGERDRPGCTGSASRRTDSAKRVSRETRDTAGETPVSSQTVRLATSTCSLRWRNRFRSSTKPSLARPSRISATCTSRQSRLSGRPPSSARRRKRFLSRCPSKSSP